LLWLLHTPFRPAPAAHAGSREEEADDDGNQVEADDDIDIEDETDYAAIAKEADKAEEDMKDALRYEPVKMLRQDLLWKIDAQPTNSMYAEIII